MQNRKNVQSKYMKKLSISKRNANLNQKTKKENIQFSN